MVYLIWLSYFFIGPWTPWWSSLVLALVFGGVSRSFSSAFRGGFGGGFLIWLLIAGYFNFKGHNVVAMRLGLLFGGMPPLAFHFALAFLMGIVHGLIASCGYSLVGVFRPTQIVDEYSVSK